MRTATRTLRQARYRSAALILVSACGAEPDTSDPPPTPVLAVVEHTAPVPVSADDLGARPPCELGCSCDVSVDQPLPSPPCAASVPTFSTEDAWRSEGQPQHGASDWLDRSRIRRIPDERMDEAVALLEETPFVRLASSQRTGRQPYLLRAVYPDYPGAPGCRHGYSVRLDAGGAVTVVNPTLRRVGLCPVAMRRAAIVALLDAPPAETHATAAALSQE